MSLPGTGAEPGSRREEMIFQRKAEERGQGLSRKNYRSIDWRLSPGSCADILSMRVQDLSHPSQELSELIGLADKTFRS